MNGMNLTNMQHNHDSSRIGIALCLFTILISPLSAQESKASTNTPGKTYTYKSSAGKERKMEIYFPPNHDPSTEKVPGLILFHGGGWRGGTLAQFRFACSYFATRGLICATVEYQLPKKDTIEALPTGQSFKRLCVTDAKSAIRWFKSKAPELGIDPDKIITGGGSAGAHISALATMNPGLNDPDDPKHISTQVIAYLWFNPAFAPDDKNDPEIDILTHLKADLPPTISFFGEKDPWKNGWDTAHAKWKSMGTKTIDLRIAEDKDHGFFNIEPWRTLTIIAADEFLVKHNLLPGKPTLTPPSSGETLNHAP